MAKVRTNIEIEDDYVRIMMDRYSVHTKTGGHRPVQTALPTRPTDESVERFAEFSCAALSGVGSCCWAALVVGGGFPTA